MSTLNNKNVLVVAAHPDDEVLGCGGAIAKYNKLGFRIHTLILGEGATSRYSKGDKMAVSEVKSLKEQAKKAARIMGVKKTFFCDFPDNRFDSVTLLDIVKEIEKIKTELKPAIVFTHQSLDLNIDHEITCRAVVTAFRPVPGSEIKRIYGFEITSSRDRGELRDCAFSPDCYIDISDHLNKKLAALSCYEGEVRNYPHPRSLPSVKALSEYRGSSCGMRNAEAFKTLLSID